MFAISLPALVPGACDSGPIDQKVDLALVRMSTISVGLGIVETAPDLAISVQIRPPQPAGCYQLDPDLKITANGQPPSSFLVLSDGGDAIVLTRDCSRPKRIIATFGLPTTTSAVKIEFSQGAARAVLDLIVVPPPGVPGGGDYMVHDP